MAAWCVVSYFYLFERNEAESLHLLDYYFKCLPRLGLDWLKLGTGNVIQVSVGVRDPVIRAITAASQALH